MFFLRDSSTTASGVLSNNHLRILLMLLHIFPAVLGIVFAKSDNVYGGVGAEIATALRQAGGVKRKAADILGTTPVTISHYMAKFPRLHKVVERTKAERREVAERNRKQKERKSGGGMYGLLNPRQRRFVDMSTL